jgi:7-cyano-7-deazaguanine reductase
VAKIKRASRLTLLGRSEAKLPTSPSEARLETFSNPAPSRNYRIHFETDDFTSVCPITGQPDFARIDIDYVPDRLCVESKSLKFYLASYRNERAFNEAVTNHILDDFVKACAPREAIVTAQFVIPSEVEESRCETEGYFRGILRLRFASLRMTVAHK